MSINKCSKIEQFMSVKHSLMDYSRYWMECMDMKDRLRKSREALHLTQEFVAKVIGLSRTAVVQIENGNRRLSADELAGFSKLYGVSADYIMGTQIKNETVEIFARGFEGLSDQDKEEIVNLIEFKKQMAIRKKGELE